MLPIRRWSPCGYKYFPTCMSSGSQAWVLVTPQMAGLLGVKRAEESSKLLFSFSLLTLGVSLFSSQLNHLNHIFDMFIKDTRQNILSAFNEYYFSEYLVSHIIRNGCSSLLHCLWECKLVQLLWKTVWRFLKALKMELPYDLSVPLLGGCIFK